MAARHPSARRLPALRRARPPRLHHSRPRCLEGPWAAGTPLGLGLSPPVLCLPTRGPCVGRDVGATSSAPSVGVLGRAGVPKHVTPMSHFLPISSANPVLGKAGASGLVGRSLSPQKGETRLEPPSSSQKPQSPAAARLQLFLREHHQAASVFPRPPSTGGLPRGRAGRPREPRAPKPSPLPAMPPRCSARDAAPGASGARRAAA